MKVKELKNILKDYKDNQEVLINATDILFKIALIEEKEVCINIEEGEYYNIDMAPDDLIDTRVAVCIINLK